MATVTQRPFPCSDNTFIDSVLQDHKKSSAEHNAMVTAHSGGTNPAPFIFTYSQHTIPTDCNAYYVKITFNHESTSNADINVAFEEWPVDAGNPRSVSGEVYYTLALWNGIKNRKGAAYLELRKAVEPREDGDYVTVVIKGFKSDGTAAFHANLTNAFPMPI